MRHPGWYSWLAVLGGAIVSMAVSVTVSVRMSDAALQRDQQQRREQAEREAVQRQQGRQASCALIKRVNDAYAGQKDELSPAGQEVAQAWSDLAKLCK